MRRRSVRQRPLATTAVSSHYRRRTVLSDAGPVCHWLGPRSQQTCTVFVNARLYVVTPISLHQWRLSFVFSKPNITKSITRRQSNLAKVASNPLPLGVWDQDPRRRQTQCSMGPQDCSPQTASWYVQPFFVEANCETDKLTDTAIIGNNSLHLMHSMQPEHLI